MIDKTLSYIDYLKLLDVIKEYASTSLIDDRVSSLRPVSSREDIGQIQARQDRLEALLELIKWNGLVPLTEIPDVRRTLSQLAIENFVFELSDFIALHDFLTRCKEITGFLKGAFGLKQYTEELLERIDPLAAVRARIRKVVNTEGFVEDSASYALSKIRSDLYQLRERAKRHLEKMMESEDVRPALQDTYVAVRNGRYVLPVKPNFNQFFQGIVHDYSHSLKTSFVEPMAIVESDNQISMLEEDEREEEQRILRELTAWMRGYRDQLEANLETVIELDFYHCLARFSLAYESVRPDMATDGSIDIREARNPFIIMSKKEKAVPIDIVMEREKKAMIISGPNAGGKTVALKTIGLLVAMAASGLFVPARGNPRITLFPAIYAVIGDEQDISMELSSFTAHVSAIKSLYEKSHGGELILIDEIGGGTEPQEASALAMGIIDAFVERGCKTLVTTHLNVLKAYGYSRAFALNAATDFDSDTIKPLYRLLYGVAGVSNAIHVAENCDMPRDIIRKSYEYLGKQEHMLNDLVKGLEEERGKLKEERAHVSKLREEAKARLAQLKEKRDEYLKAAEERCRVRLLETERELEEIRKEALKKERTSVRRARDRLRLIQDKHAGGVTAAEIIRVGDHVRVKSVGRDGYVIRIDEEKHNAEVDLGGMKMKVHTEYLFKVPGQVKTNARPVEVHVAPIEVPELNVRGMRVEEALREVDRFIDRAIVHGTTTLRIVHGIGTGALMDAIRHRLLETPHIVVKGEERNSGVTIVELQ
ncbi:MAG TPA: Smr/MutS family protein [Syntrophorhabdales bacterium]|nr:Smr/MutS family protein [Syntrophorhabdales bacterium]